MFLRSSLVSLAGCEDVERSITEQCSTEGCEASQDPENEGWPEGPREEVKTKWQWSRVPKGEPAFGEAETRRCMLPACPGAWGNSRFWAGLGSEREGLAANEDEERRGLACVDLGRPT